MTIKMKTRSRLLAGVGTTVLATMLVGGAQAAGTEVTIPGLGPISDWQASASANGVAEAVLSNTATISATVHNQTSSINWEADPDEPTGTSNDVTDNLISGTATGNSFTNLVENELLDGEGLAAIGFAVNEDGAVVSSRMTDNALSVDLTGLESGSAVNSGNTIRARTTVNDGNTSLTGNIPNGYESNVEGSSTSSYGGAGAPHEAEGSIVASTMQINTVSGHFAAVNDDDTDPTRTGNSISLTLDANDNTEINSSPALDNNTISADLSVNRSRSTIGLGIGAADPDEGGAPTYAGSAVVTNLQLNLGSASAENSDSTIAATVLGTGAGNPVNELEGGLSVSGNRISSAISGNRATGDNGAGNRIVIGDALSVAGPGTTDPNGPGAFFTYDSSSVESGATADLVILNSQGNNGFGTGTALTATTEDAAITAYVQSLDGGAIDLSDNAITSRAHGNAASSEIASSQNAASFDASVAVASQQTNNSNDVSANTTGTNIVAITSGNPGGVTNNSTITVAENRSGATAYGNDVSQTVALNATTLNADGGHVTMGGGTVGATNDGNVAADGRVTVTNLQSSYNSDVRAINSGSIIGLDADARTLADTITASTLTTTENDQEAVAISSSASNNLTLTGNSLGGGAGIASVQIQDDDSSVNAALTGAQVGLIASTHVDDSSLAVTENIQRALAYGNSASNSLVADGNSYAIEDGGAGVSISYDSGAAGDRGVFHSPQPSVEASFGVMNDQSVLDDVTASANGNTIGLFVEGDLNQSSAANDRNALVAAAYGNDGSSRLRLGNADTPGGNVVNGAFASVAMIGNTQSVGAEADISATAFGPNVVLTDIEDDVVNGSVSTSSNVVQALGIGSRSTNNMSVFANSVTVAGATDPGVSTVNQGDWDLSSTIAFGVVNAQAGGGSVSASLVDDVNDPTQSASIVTRLGSAYVDPDPFDGYTPSVSNSTIVSNGNQLLAGATSNSAAGNVISINANDVATTTGVQNLQVTNANVSALIGVEGSDGTPLINYPGAAGTGSTTGTGSVNSEGVLTVNAGGSVEIDYSNVTDPAARAALEALLNAANLTATGGTATGGPGSYDLSFFTSFNYTGGTISFTGFTDPGTPQVAPMGGVSIVASGSEFTEGFTIENSTLSVAGNVTAGSVTGNSAVNRLAIDATNISAGGNLAAAEADFDGGDVELNADHSVSNVQAVTAIDGDTDPLLSSTVHGTFSIETWLDTVAGDEAVISNSSLTVSDNEQSARSVANTAANTVLLEGNEIATTSALASWQASEAAVAAESGLDIRTAAAVSNSSVDMSGNTNTSLAVINDVTNNSTISGTNLTPLGAPDATASMAWEDVTGTHVLLNVQEASTSATSTAATRIYNLDEIAAETSGLYNSTLTIVGNETYSEATANRANNFLTLNGAASQAATGGLFNNQTSSAVVQAEATTSARVTLSGEDSLGRLAASDSSVTVDGNRTTALARGNDAVNALTSTAGAGYGTPSGSPASAAVGANGMVVTATAAVLNAQTNEGAVTARSENARYSVALNAGPGEAAVARSSVSVSNNRVGTEAYGNRAVNSISLTSLNTGVPTAAIGSTQSNSGAIMASVTGAHVGISSTGLSGGSSLSVGGNTISAGATGNSVTNVLSRASR